jgi:hypothetical protein
MKSRKTLCTVPGLTDAAALIVNCPLNLPVSLTTGVDAVASAFPELYAHRVFLSFLLPMGIVLI